MAARQVSISDLDRIAVSCNYLRDARDGLRKAGARQASAYVARALKSAEGAYRHAVNLSHRQERARIRAIEQQVRERDPLAGPAQFAAALTKAAGREVRK